MQNLQAAARNAGMSWATTWYADDFNPVIRLPCQRIAEQLENPLRLSARIVRALAVPGRDLRGRTLIWTYHGKKLGAGTYGYCRAGAYTARMAHQV